MQIIKENQEKRIDDDNSINQLDYSERAVEEMKLFDLISITLQNEITIKNSKNYIKKIKIFKKQILIIIGFGLCYFLYYLSLESCLDGEGPCATRVNWIILKVIEEIISCILLTFMIQIIILKKISKMNFIHIIFMFIFFYYYRHGLNFVDHGYFNFFFFFNYSWYF